MSYYNMKTKRVNELTYYATAYMLRDMKTDYLDITSEKIAFEIFCIESYAQHACKQGNDIYSLFNKEEVFNLLETYYDELHSMGIEALIDFLDSLFGIKIYENHSGHSMVKSLILPEVIKMISEKQNISLEHAMADFYQSGTGAAFADDETGLYSQSSLYIFSLYEYEKARY